MSDYVNGELVREMEPYIGGIQNVIIAFNNGACAIWTDVIDGKLTRYASIQAVRDAIRECGL